jgi:hypothetical protein
MKRALLVVIFVLAAGGIAVAADFGFVLSPSGEYVSGASGEGFGFTGTFTPWFSAALAETMNLYLSGKLTVEYQYDKKAWATPLLVELDRTELSFHPIERAYLVFGRQRFGDPGGMILSGLFDGFYGRLGLGSTQLSLGAFYTGLLYKKAAEIFMTAEDRARYAAPLDYGDFDTYFASRRVLVSLGLELPDMASRLSLTLNGLAQFDANGGKALHTQYLEAQAGIEAASSLRFTVTGVGALAEKEDAATQGHFAAAFGADWDVPGALTDMIQAGLRWGSGASSDRFGAFKPVNDMAEGKVFSSALPGLMNARLSYMARPHRAFSFSLGGLVFWRTDLETFTDSELDGGSKARFLGTEASGSLVWAPQSALRLTAGAGVFFPGAAFTDSAKTRWKINGGLTLSL